MNPITHLRTTHGYTQKQLADLLGITEQTIRRTEQGTFTQIPKTIFFWATTSANADPSKLTTQYEDWRRAKRNALSHIAERVGVFPYDVDAHPFVKFRERFMDIYFSMEGHSDLGRSLSGFTKLVAIDPRIIKNFESSYSTHIPEGILILLRDLKYPRMGELQGALYSWNTYGIGGE